MNRKVYLMPNSADIQGLVEEYSALIGEARNASQRLAPKKARELVQGALVAGADWTPQAAERLTELAVGYGSFMLRNALALAIALGHEDGALGY